MDKSRNGKAPFFWTEKVLLGACGDVLGGYLALRSKVEEAANIARKENWENPRWRPKVLRECIKDLVKGMNLVFEVLDHLDGKNGQWVDTEDESKRAATLSTKAPPLPVRCSGTKAGGKPCSSYRLVGKAFCRHHLNQGATPESVASLVSLLAGTLSRPQGDD